MGSLRNPIGPLPSSIYWRRRAVALAILVGLVLLVVWALSLGGDSGDQGQRAPGGKDNGRGPTDPITPGPTDSVPSVTERPGGRDETDDGTASGGDGDGDDSSTSGGPEGDKGGDGPSGDGGTGALSGSGGSLTGGDGAPADPGLPDCSSKSVTVVLKSAENEYEPGDSPELKLTLRNEGDGACRVDLGRTATVLTIKQADGERVWSSADCPADRSAAWVKVPAGGKTTHTLEWDRRRSKPACATPAGGKVAPGDYRAELKVAGLSAERTSFVLARK